MPRLLVAHAEGEEHLAEEVALPLEEAGYEISHSGRVVVGDSVVGEAAKALEADMPVVLCATIKAVGTPWGSTVVNAARARGCPVYALQFDRDANVRLLTFEERVLEYWRNPDEAMAALLMALTERYPLESLEAKGPAISKARERYRDLALAAVDIIDLANLPEMDRHVAARQLELRALYVPLRVTTETQPGQEIDESKLRELEERRRTGAPEQEQGSPEPGAPEHGHVGGRVPVGERLAASRRLIVLGDPGAGKTTLIRWLATAYLLRLYANREYEALPDVATLPNEELLPIIVRCRDLDEEAVSGSLEDVLRRTFRKSEMTAEEADALMIAFREDLRDGRALLLVDGLDEIQDPAQRARFCAQLEQISLAYPRAFLLATSRIVGYREMGIRVGRGFEHVTVADLSSDDKDDFARRWCAVTEPEHRRETAAAELIVDIHSADRIERLTGNPMLLTTMALVKRKVGKLPSGRAELYADAVDVLLRWRREVDEPIDQREALPQLQYVAHAMCDRGVQQLRETELLELLERIREEYPRIRPLQNHPPEEFLQLLERRTGILVQAGAVRDPDGIQPVYEFRHLTFQEYLAATALVQGRYPGRDANLSLGQVIAPLAGRTTRDDEVEGEVGISENWREALQLCVAVCDDDHVDDAIEAIITPLPGEDPTVARPRAVLAASCLIDEPNVSDDVARRVLETLCRMIDERDGQEYGTSSVDAAFWALAQTEWRTPLTEAVLQEFCKRELPSRVAVGGTFILAAQHQSPGTVVHMQSWLEGAAASLASDSDRFVTVALELAAIPRFTSRYIAQAVGRSQPDLMAEVWSGLARRAVGGDPGATAALLALARLRRLDARPEEMPPELLQVLEDAGSPPEHLVLALDVMGSPFLRSLMTPANSETTRMTEAAVSLLRHPELSVRLAVMQTLRYVVELPADLRDPVRQLARDEEAEVRAMVAEALPVDGWTDVLETLVDDTDPNVRAAALRAASRRPDGQALVYDALDSNDAERRWAAASALAYMQPSDAMIPLLLRMAESPVGEERLAALLALRGVPHPEVRALLRTRAEEDDAPIRARLVESLAPDEDDDLTVLIRLTTDSDGRVRESAVLQLSESPIGRSGQALLDALSDPLEPVQTAAAQALVASADPDLVRAAIDYFRGVRTQARYLRVPRAMPEAHAGLYAELLEMVDDRSRGDILAGVARGCGVSDEDLMILSTDFDGLSPFLDPTQRVSEERIQDVSALLNVEPEDVRARYQALAERVGIMVDGWA